MKIFDCFMYFDEEVILDLRLNILNPYIDYFIIVESSYTHKGDKRNLKFDIKKFDRFKEKIIYLTYDEIPIGIEEVFEDDSEDEKSRKLILNAAHRENGQRNYISKGLENAQEEDLVLISDVDEIPNLKNLNLKEIKNEIILFKQDMFYYKLNLKMPDMVWSGTKGCKKRNFKNPQWLRNIKDRKYPIYRLDTFFSEKKYMNLKFIDNGGWHFSNIKTSEEIEHKLKSYLHHREFDVNPLSISEIDGLIKNKEAIYNLKVDKKAQKIGHGNKLNIYDIKKLPSYISSNKEKFKEWID